MTPPPTPTPADATSWTQLVVAPGPAPREDHTWTSLGDLALLFGGLTGDGPVNDLWSFDLATNQWYELHPSGPGPAPRFGHTATWVPDVGLVVWSGQGDTFFDDIWVYDPAVDAWHELPSLGDVPEARYGSCASLGPDGRLWISHGFTQDDGRFADTRAYDFATGEWIDETPDGDVPVKRCLHDCYWSNAGELILYGGQTTGVAALGDIWSYDLQARAWTQGPESSAAPRQLYAMAAGNAAFDGLAFGGGSLEGGYLDDLIQINSDSLQVLSGNIDGAPAARSGATLIQTPGFGTYLLFGGQNADGLLSDVWSLQGYWLGP
ncbi:MAG TPA: kelch repeat-containing protein [Candidatus Limnocylindria bacterium]|nr:kelch repeat-containing protein [Candidatus Limnocylindria bacterium]